MRTGCARKGLRVRYQGAAHGCLWPRIGPRALIGLYIFVFSFVFKSAISYYRRDGRRAIDSGIFKNPDRVGTLGRNPTHMDLYGS